MQFQIPQFIEVENKIVGPLTLKQFLYLAAAGGLSFLFFFIFSMWLWLFITMIMAVVAFAFAFIKYNGQSLVKIVFNAFGFFWKPRLYLWQREIEEKIIEVPDFSVETKRKNLREYFSGMPSVKRLLVDLMTSKNPIPKREKGLSHWGITAKERLSAFRKLTGEKEITKRVDYR